MLVYYILKTSLTPPLYWSVCTNTGKWADMYMSVKGVDFDSVFTIFRLDLETVPTVWFFLFFFPHFTFNICRIFRDDKY